MLDLGAASGRVIRHFCAQSAAEQIWAADLSSRHVAWMNTFLPKNLMAFSNSALPMLPLEDASLDLVVAFSVFTHMDTFETSWLAELRRVLRTGGVAYLTVHDEHTWRQLGSAPETDRLRAGLDESKSFEPSMLDQPLPGARPSFRFSELGPYRCNVFHSTAHLHDVWGRFFEIVDIHPLRLGTQSVVVMRKP